MHGGCHIWPWLNECNGVVSTGFTLSRSTGFTDGEKPEVLQPIVQGDSLFSGIGQEICD